MRLLECTHPVEHKFEKIVVWSSNDTLERLPNYPWIIKQTHPWLNCHIGSRFLWRAIHFRSQIKLFRCDSIFSPGALFFLIPGVPVICMGQNLLPFDMRETFRFGFSFFTLKLLMLRLSQSFSLHNSNGNIFLSHFSRNEIENVLGKNNATSVVIPHGVDRELFLEPRIQDEISSYSREHPFRLLYISPVWPYKNHDSVILAVSLLRKAGYWVRLDIVGGHPHKPSLKKMTKLMRLVDKNQEYIFYHGARSYEDLISYYHEAQLFIFASSCESFGQIVTEAMASGLPIACSDLSSMQEILKDGAVYFNPFDQQGLFQELIKLINSPQLRAQIASRAINYSSDYSWKKCTGETLNFITEQTQNSQNYKTKTNQIEKNLILVWKSSVRNLLKLISGVPWSSNFKKLIAILFIGFGIFYFYQNLAQFSELFLSLNKSYIYIGVACATLAFIFGALKLSLTFEYAFGKKINFLSWLKAYLESFFINSTVPYLGLAYRGLYLKKFHGIPYSEYVSASYIAAVLGVLILLFFSVAALSFDSNNIIFLTLFIVLVLVLIIKFLFVSYIANTNFKNKKFKIYLEKLKVLQVHLNAIHQNQHFLKYLAFFIVVAAVDFFVYACVLYSFTDLLPFSSVILIYLAYSSSWFFRLTPGNIGIQELLISLASSFVGFGVISGVALSLTLRATYLLGAALLYCITVIYKNR
jgi:glycosyltransferase involved in cell wall biosynthesis/uncharacterized membrane protein YbhN (UPF0104 family)